MHAKDDCIDIGATFLESARSHLERARHIRKRAVSHISFTANLFLLLLHALRIVSRLIVLRGSMKCDCCDEWMKILSCQVHNESFLLSMKTIWEDLKLSALQMKALIQLANQPFQEGNRPRGSHSGAPFVRTSHFQVASNNASARARCDVLAKAIKWKT